MKFYYYVWFSDRAGIELVTKQLVDYLQHVKSQDLTSWQFSTCQEVAGDMCKIPRVYKYNLSPKLSQSPITKPFAQGACLSDVTDHRLADTR